MYQLQVRFRDCQIPIDCPANSTSVRSGRQRKTKCSGGSPCTACDRRQLTCAYQAKQRPGPKPKRRSSQTLPPEELDTLRKPSRFLEDQETFDRRNAGDVSDVADTAASTVIGKISQIADNYDRIASHEGVVMDCGTTAGLTPSANADNHAFSSSGVTHVAISNKTNPEPRCVTSVIDDGHHALLNRVSGPLRLPVSAFEPVSAHDIIQSWTDFDICRNASSSIDVVGDTLRETESLWDLYTHWPYPNESLSPFGDFLGPDHAEQSGHALDAASAIHNDDDFEMRKCLAASFASVLTPTDRRKQQGCRPSRTEELDAAVSLLNDDDAWREIICHIVAEHVLFAFSQR